jgi:hypothetical protein
VTAPNSAPRLLVRTWSSSIAVAGVLAEQGVKSLAVSGAEMLSEKSTWTAPAGPRTVAARSTDLPDLLMSVAERTVLATDDRSIVIHVEGGTFRIFAGAEFQAAIDTALRSVP